MQVFYPCSATVMDASVFDRILKHDEWLRDENVDILLNMVMYNASTKPEQFHQDWACLDYLAWDRISCFKKEEAFKRLVMYVEGSLPRERQIAWTNVNRVYGVAHVEGKHWVAFEVALQGEFIMVYDSMSAVNDWEIVAGYFFPMSLFMPWVCKKLGIKKKAGNKPELEKWPVYRHPNTPQQVTPYDCGIMAVKMIECLAAGTSLSKIDSQNCGKYRDAYCAQVWDLRTHE